MQLQPEGLGDEFKIPQANLDLPRLHFGQVAPVDARPLGHLKLGPAPLLAEFPDASADPDADVAGHPPMMVCSL